MRPENNGYIMFCLCQSEIILNLWVNLTFLTSFFFQAPSQNIRILCQFSLYSAVIIRGEIIQEKVCHKENSSIWKPQAKPYQHILTAMLSRSITANLLLFKYPQQPTSSRTLLCVSICLSTKLQPTSTPFTTLAYLLLQSALPLSPVEH